MAKSGSGSLRSVVDLDRGLVGREIYVDEDIYRQELEQVFARAWLFVGHESQVPHPGDFVVSRMGEEEVILVRDRKGTLHVFLNTCRHRGMKVCRYDDGNTLLFTCPFHAWSYDTDGRLVGVPYQREAWGDSLDKSKWGLAEVAQMCNFYGSVWATWDAGAPPFEDYLGPYADTVRRCFQSTDGEDNGVEVFNPVNKWMIPCNWKFPAFSFDGDSSHAAMTHRSVNAAQIGPAGGANNGDRHGLKPTFPNTVYEMSVPELGHGGHNPIYEQPGMPPFTETWLTEPGVDDYYRETHAKRAAKYAGQYTVGKTALIWPNVNIEPDRILIWHPSGPGQTQSWRLYPIDREAPQHVKDAQRHYMMRYGGPCGLTESDDMENWNYAAAASAGHIARRYPYNFQMGLGDAFTSPQAPGMTLNRRYAEENQRARLLRWLEFMEADSWNDINPVALHQGKP